jgi:hypothetical protein
VSKWFSRGRSSEALTSHATSKRRWLWTSRAAMSKIGYWGRWIAQDPEQAGLEREYRNYNIVEVTPLWQYIFIIASTTSSTGRVPHQLQLNNLPARMYLNKYVVQNQIG